MTRRLFTSAALAIAGLASVAVWDGAHAASPAGPAAVSTTPPSQHPLRMAQATVTQPKTTRKTKHTVQHPQTNWLNPQPEPPSPAHKPVKGGTWLNPQPEPPRPDTTKKPQ